MGCLRTFTIIEEKKNDRSSHFHLSCHYYVCTIFGKQQRACQFIWSRHVKKSAEFTTEDDEAASAALDEKAVACKAAAMVLGGLGLVVQQQPD